MNNVRSFVINLLIPAGGCGMVLHDLLHKTSFAIMVKVSQGLLCFNELDVIFKKVKWFYAKHFGINIFFVKSRELLKVFHILKVMIKRIFIYSMH